MSSMSPPQSVLFRFVTMAATAATLSLTAPGPVAAQSSLAPPAGFSDPDRLARLTRAFPDIDRLVADFAGRNNVPGFAYGVIIDGRLVHARAGGVRNVAAAAAVDTTTVFRIASMTKSFTAAAILQLRDEGKLSLDDPAERYLPELASIRYPTTDSPRITIRHLLSHSEGFPEDNPWGDQQLAATDEEFSRMIRSGIPFSNAPGVAYEYSNYGFAMLGRIVANVSGLPFPRYLTERLLTPLGMRHTTLEFSQVPSGLLAHGYRRQDGQWLEEQPLPDGAFGPMGGLLTSVGDLGRWVAFMLDAWPPRDGTEPGPLRRASVREMQQVARFNGATAAITSAGVALSAGGYGYGLGVRQTCRHRVTVAHSGGLPGYGSIMRWLPDYGVGIVAMGNLTYTSWGNVTDQAFEALAATGGLEPRTPRPAPVLTTMRDQVTRLVLQWDDALARDIAAMNLYLDEPAARRRAAIERVRTEAGGNCRPEGGFVAENALRGRWRLRCNRGDLRVTITLAPTEPARVQHLDVAPLGRDESLAPLPACR